MGASVGVGGLIIGVSMLVVFSMAYQSIAMQIDSGLDRIEHAEQPTATFRIDDATLWEGAVVAVTISNGGAGYTAGGTVVASSGTGGFSGTYTVNNVTGAISSVVITSHGNYSASPTLTVTGGGTPTTNATFSVTLGKVIYANLTNTGSGAVHHDQMWLFVDGQNATGFSTAYSSSISSERWYSGETLALQWFNASVSGTERLALTVGSTTVAHILG